MTPQVFTVVLTALAIALWLLIIVLWCYYNPEILMRIGWRLIALGSGREQMRRRERELFR